MHTPGDGAHADTEESRVEVYVTTDTSAAPHKADEAKLYVMYDAADPDGDKLYFDRGGVGGLRARGQGRRVRPRRVGQPTVTDEQDNC